jgi:hypothetical protein
VSGPTRRPRSAGSGSGGRAGYLRKTNDAAHEILGGTRKNVRVLTLGDSLSLKKINPLSTVLRRALGGRTGLGGWLVTNVTGGDVGAPTNQVDQTAVWAQGALTAFAAGDKRSYGVSGANAIWDKATVYYIKEPGAGTFTVQVDDVNEPGATAVDANAASGLGVITITRGTAATRKLSIVGVTGTVRIVPPSWENTTRVGGLFWSDLGQGNLNLATAMASATGRANLQTYIADFLPDLITFEVKEVGSTVNATVTALLDIILAAAPQADVVMIGSSPVSGNDADQKVANAGMKAAVTARTGQNAIYWDGYTPLVDYPTVLALGWQGDGTHLHDDAQSFLAGLMANDLGLWDILADRSGFDFNADFGRCLTSLAIGRADDGTDVFQFDADTTFKLDAYATIRRQLRFRDYAGTEYGALGAASGFDTWWRSQARKGFRVGDPAGPYIEANVGSPEGNKTAPVGSIYLRTNGGPGFAVFVKASGTGNTGWIVLDSMRTTQAWDPPSVAAGAFTSTTVTVAGCAVGDCVQVGFTPAVPAGVILTGQVTAANTVTVTLVNHTGAAVDLAAGTLLVRVTE